MKNGNQNRKRLGSDWREKEDRIREERLIEKERKPKMRKGNMAIGIEKGKKCRKK